MPYTTISESIRRNGDRHKANAERYLAQGLTEYAAGSMRKAERNYRKAEELDAFLAVPPILKPIYDELLRAIEDKLFNSVR